MSIEIKKVDANNKKELIKFFKMQNMYYRDNANYVPPIIVERLDLVNKSKNPFFSHADIQLFLAYRDGGLSGRIATITNDNHNKTHNDNVGFFGFFECDDDQEIANALFDTAEKWLKEKGKDTMRGPINLSLNDEVGMLISSFDTLPYILTTYNPDYYPSLCDNAGFEKAMDLYSYELNRRAFLTEKMKRLNDLIIKRFHIEIEQLELKDKVKKEEHIKALKYIYNNAWEPNWGHVQLEEPEFDKLIKDLTMIADTRITFLAKVNGKIAGVAVGLPDINQALKFNKKGSLIGAIWHLLTKKRKINRLRVFILGVLPEFHNTGVDAVMYYEFGKRAELGGYEMAEASWILENNIMMNKAMTETVIAKMYKTHRIYDRAIE